MKADHCPCCGESKTLYYDGEKPAGLYLGTLASTREGVHCYSCGLTMAREWPDVWPKKLPAAKTYQVRIKRLRKYVLEQAVAAWNQRKGCGQPTPPIGFNPGKSRKGMS